MESGDPLVSAEWLLKNFDAPDIRVLDATYFADFTNPPETGRQAWARGHAARCREILVAHPQAGRRRWQPDRGL
jgi:hypothetical protein